MHQTLNILFTCAGRRNYLINYFKDALKGNGNVIAVDKQLNAPALVDADIAEVVPDIYDENYIDEILNVITKHKVSAVISLNDLELPILAANKHKIETHGCKVLVSDLDVINICFDKWKTYLFLKEAGVKTPKTYLTLDDALKAIKNNQLQFPVVLKPRWGSASISIDFPEDIEELKLAFALQSKRVKRSILQKASNEDPDRAIVIQEKLQGKEYGMDVVNDFDCNYFDTFLREKLSMRSGETDKALSVKDERFETVGKTIANKLRHLGNMDCDAFLHDDNLYILELNPRFGGGYPFSHESGANIAGVYIEWLKGNKEVNKYINYIPNLTFSKCDRLLRIPEINAPTWNLEVKHIKTEAEFESFKKLAKQIHSDNPFYNIKDFQALSATENSTSCYFLFSKNAQPIVIMPFYLREISVDNKKSDFYDVTSPYGYSGPLFDPDNISEDVLKKFWESVDNWYAANHVVSEFIRFSLNNNHLGYNGVLVPSLRNVKGKILDEETQWNNFKPKVRNNYRKALQHNLSIKIYYQNIAKSEIEAFYNIYIKTMQRTNADIKYFLPLSYFTDFISRNPENCALALVFKDDITISGELILVSSDTLYSFMGGTLADYFNCRPNDFLKIEIMKWARATNKKYYVLGGGITDKDNLYKYKKSFFSKDEDVIYYTGRKIIDKTAYKTLVKSKTNFNVDLITDIEHNYFPLYRAKN